MADNIRQPLLINYAHIKYDANGIGEIRLKSQHKDDPLITKPCSEDNPYGPNPRLPSGFEEIDINLDILYVSQGKTTMCALSPCLSGYSSWISSKTSQGFMGAQKICCKTLLLDMGDQQLKVYYNVNLYGEAIFSKECKLQMRSLYGELDGGSLEIFCSGINKNISVNFVPIEQSTSM